MTVGLLVMVVVAATPAELNERFSRAVRLFDEGRIADASLEFETLEQLQPNAVVEFNLAHCQARLGHPVQAVRLLEPLVTDDSKLPATRRDEAKQLLAAQRARVSSLELTGPDHLEGVLELDGETSRTTLPTTLQVDPGTHNLGFQANGYFPSRKVVSLGEGASTRVALELLKEERPPARLRLECSVPGVAVQLDGQQVATTPFTSTIAVQPGLHELVASRPGYQKVQQTLSLAENAAEVVTLALVPDGTHAVALQVQPSETQAVVSIDGARVATGAPVAIPVGPHEVKVEREGFFPMHQAVTLEGDLTLPATLEPTSQTLVALEQSRWLHRFWGTVGLVVGAGTIAGGVVVTVNQQAQVDSLQKIVDEMSTCNPGHMQCDFSLDAKQKNQDDLYALQWGRLGGILLGGLGALIVGAGVVSFATAPDLSRYENQSTSGTLAPISLSLGVGPGSVTLAGRF